MRHESNCTGHVLNLPNCLCLFSLTGFKVEKIVMLYTHARAHAHTHTHTHTRIYTRSLTHHIQYTHKHTDTHTDIHRHTQRHTDRTVTFQNTTPVINTDLCSCSRASLTVRNLLLMYKKLANFQTPWSNKKL